MRHSILLALCLTAGAALASAGTITVSGDTSTSPFVWDRPTEGAPPPLISVFGTNVPYVSFGFQVSLAGDYTFEVVLPVFDSFLVLFQDPFDPLDPLTNAIVAVDDGPATATLVAAVPYTLVVTGFFDTDSGPFDASISGPGDISTASSDVPEPTTGGVTLVGMALLVARRRGLL
ncbi:MAG: PEP-CTERM sorting domain-containing protein [Bryobacterales bacterium]|nr:PEP-CTERM sorting domain-containing protein [Bryobacterales bacterium]